jgi:hypothetical protein
MNVGPQEWTEANDEGEIVGPPSTPSTLRPPTISLTRGLEVSSLASPARHGGLLTQVSFASVNKIATFCQKGPDQGGGPKFTMQSSENRNAISRLDPTNWRHRIQEKLSSFEVGSECGSTEESKFWTRYDLSRR